MQADFKVLMGLFLLYLLFWKVLCYFILVHVLATLQLLPLDPLDALTLHVTGADQHALQGAEAEVIVALR